MVTILTTFSNGLNMNKCQSCSTELTRIGHKINKLDGKNKY